MQGRWACITWLAAGHQKNLIYTPRESLGGKQTKETGRQDSSCYNVRKGFWLQVDVHRLQVRGCSDRKRFLRRGGGQMWGSHRNVKWYSDGGGGLA